MELIQRLLKNLISEVSTIDQVQTLMDSMLKARITTDFILEVSTKINQEES